MTTPPIVPASSPVPRRPATWLRWVAASRPGFLSVTLVAALLGVVQSAACGAGWQGWTALATVLLALLTHAAVNLYNDYGDAVGGSDAINTGRLFPFSGGSRVIQDGVFSVTQVRQAAAWLALVVVAGGLLLAAYSGPGLLLVGLAGLALGWAYSSPRVALMAHGWGEVAVAAGWWLIVVGADYVQRHAFSGMAAISGVSIALLVGAVLWIAEFPDAQADAAAGKRTWVVRLGAPAAARGYAWLVLAAHAWVAVWWWADGLPRTAGWALGSAPLSLTAACWLRRHAGEPSRLRPAIGLTIAAAVVHGLLLTAAFVVIARLR
jgi:1,4-dihydroxy-2-naphthoate octaprenyltransferase